MRKIVASIIAFNILTTAVQAATVTTMPNYKTGEITVSGVIEEARTNMMISLEARDSQNNIAHISYITPEFDGSFSYTFKMPEDAITGEYELRLGAAQLATPVSEKVEYIMVSEINQLVSDIQSVTLGGNTSAEKDAAINSILAAVDGKLNTFGVEDTKYSLLPIESKKKIAEEILASRNDYDAISAAANKGYAVQVLNVINTNEVASYLDKYEDVYGLDSAEMKTEFEALNDKTRFSSLFDTYKFENTSDVVKAVNEATFITILEKSQPGDFVNLFENHQAVIPFSLDKYTSLGAETVAYALAGKTVNSMQDLESMINAIGAGSGTGSGSGSGSAPSGNGASGFGGGGSGSFGGTSTPTVPQTSSSFTDLSGSDWAKDAIEVLYQKGIVSGVGEGSFEPTRNIKREEFVKIVLSAFGLFDSNYTAADFDDIDSDSWAYPYICKAYQLGIISGVGGKSFGMGSYITRQDMAVIISRAAAAAGKTLEKVKDASEFADDGNISSYAKDAVGELVGAGIINGFEDGSFRPNDNATRAQSAVMIYNVIK